MPPPPEMSPSGESGPRRPLHFGSAIAVCLRKAVRARGRAAPEEFWYFALFWLGTGALAVGLGDSTGVVAVADIATGIYMLLLVPLVTAGIRRLHDTGRGGGWWFLAFFVIGLIILIVMLSMRGQPHTNRFGDPL